MNTLTIVLPKGKLGKDALQVIEKIGLPTSGVELDSAKMIFDYPEENLRYLVCRPADVPVYVDYGAADLGIVGKDVIVETGLDVFELVDLKFGKCEFVVAVPRSTLEKMALSPENEVLPRLNHCRAATKFPRVASDYFRKRGLQVEIIKLYGNVELAPRVGLAEMIVDIVSTGKTLRENNLVAVSAIFQATARLIANRVSYRLKHQVISVLTDKFSRAV